MSSFSFKIWLAIWGAVLAAVYFAFDNQCNKDPDFDTKNKLKNKTIFGSKEIQIIHPCKKQIDDDYKLLLSELQVAESLMSVNDQENAVRHFANAIVMSSDPFMFINCLKHTLPTLAFNELMNVLDDTYGNDFRKECEKSSESLYCELIS